MTTVLWILGLLVALVVAVFAGQNAQPVLVHFLVWQTSARLPVVIFISAALGAVVAGILGAIPLVRTRLKLRHLNADLAQARSAASRQQVPVPAPVPEAQPAAPPAPSPAASAGEAASPGESA